ncbi:MAG: M23 family metallopeptidase [Myxococcota bacterium]
MISLLAGCATAGSSRSSASPTEPVAQTTPAPAPAPAAAKPTTSKQQKTAAAPTTSKKSARPVLPVKKVVPPTVATELDQQLRRFAASRGMVRTRKRAEIMPAEVERGWYLILDQVERACMGEPEEGTEAVELSTFIRTRVTLEAEFEQDERRYKSVPPDLKARWREALGLVDERVRMLRENADGGFALAQRVESDEPVTLVLPVQMVNITSYYGHRRDPIMRHKTRFHAGVDLAGAEGSLVTASGPGIVAYSDWHGGSGNHIVVLHAHGYRTHYSHLSKILVEPGTRVEAGTPLGLMGDTGRSTGPHLHFAVSRNGQFMDPLDALEVPLTADGPAVPRS